jgi:peptidoglycan/xylan/chitin deacetylase (PgdA/CDA1 family)
MRLPTTTTTRVTVISKGATSQRVVALTFDAGSDAGYTNRILDILTADHIPATFGITGLWAQANPDLLRRIASGDQIVNHSWDHQSFTGASTNAAALTASQIAQELQRTDVLVRQLTGVGSAGWFRPPYGDRSPNSDASAAAAGYRYELMWTVDTLGWKGVSPDTIVQRVLAALAPGEIILMHVGSASTDAAALPALIAAVEARGYRFVTVSALLP